MKKILSFIAALAFSLTCFVFPAQAEEKIKVACVGDSITEGWASTNLDTQSYPAHLQKLLGDGYDVRNFGIGGRTAMKVADGMTPYWNETFFTQSKDFNPDVVLLMLGTNDVVTKNWNGGETYYPDLKALVEVYQNLPSNPTVYLATPSTAFDADHPAELQGKAVPIVKQVAEETGATLVDINALTANNGAYYPDGIHPSDEGYYRLALMFYENAFGGKVYDLTVKTEAGAIVHNGELSAVAGTDGNAVIPAVEGDASLAVSKIGAGFIRVTANVTGDCIIDASNIDFPVNIAASSVVYDLQTVVTSVTDADKSTGWQRSEYDFSNMNLVFDFGAEKKISAVDIMWEESTRAKKDSYKVEYTADGNTWTEIPNAISVMSGEYDYIVFDEVNATKLRITITNGVSGKTSPKIFEMGIYSGADETALEGTASTETSSDITSSPENNEGNNGGKIVVIVIAVAVVSVIAVAAVLVIKKKK